MTTEEFFKLHRKVAVGFSGGVDSTYLLYVAKQYCEDVAAYYVKTVFQPEFEFDDVKKAAELIGVKLTVIEKDVLADGNVRANGGRRCYYCKTNIFGLIAETAERDGYKTLLDGSNASDDEGDRPGMKALKELSVLSPLRECGLTKADIRELSKQAGLFTWDKPAYACLATRIPTGTEITKEALIKVEKAENAMFALGLKNFRVRMNGKTAKLQTTESYAELILKKRHEVLEALSDFEETVLDLKPREE